MSTNIQDYVEILNAEQYVQVEKLAEHARHGITPKVRGEVWLYLLKVLSADKTSEITSIISMNSLYQSLESDLPSDLQILLTKTALAHHARRFHQPTYAGLISSITAESSRGSNNSKTSAQSAGNGLKMNTTPAQPFDQGNNGAGSWMGNEPSSSSNRSRGSTVASQSRPSGSTSQGHSRDPSGRVHVLEQFSSTASQRSTDHPTDKSERSERSERVERQDRVQRQDWIERTNVGPVDDGTTTLRSQVSRFLPPPPTTPPTRQAYLSTLIEVFGKYHNSQRAKGKDRETRRLSSGLDDTEANWVYLATPFICCLSRPTAIYLGFEKLAERMESFPPLPSQLASLLLLVRQALPELFSFFEDEQVPYVQVAMGWLKSLLSREMWLGDVLRLWDAYLASTDMFALHCYVCVAVLATCKETLEELDGSEVKLMLMDLPPLDVDRLLQDAASLRVSFPLPVPAADDDA
ncbi:hypothetical protein BD324DRAFT_460250 [Kockovaella imperatae]|uniref:Rab-GAP TBC domain-containing protein n=1 Tax=Kockovaella imperatae TaxID=4999 RepID=A0A1Y1UF27_9TREE|nr:hypothetical protein BD324DRAFT_460250 [Kockovaella imperatae]ORX36671.1 hypothetical protein BD324DRAFT_460250 [Kockovaella imperatae]